jgi:putative oxidoreductase
MDTALLIVRLIIGLGLAVHGAQKLFGWFGGYGIAGTGGWFESIGFKPGKLFAAAAGLGEFAGGLLVALGFLGALGPAAVLGVMLVAILTVHIKNGFLSTGNGWEMPVLYIAGAFALPFTGFGAYSLDHAFGLTLLTSTTSVWVLYGLAVIQALLNLAIKKAPAPTSAA